MVFKRRDRRPFWRVVLEALWPRGGWGRAALYVKHRLNRLPDPPERIARGVFAGVFITFTPFYGLHFIMSALLAWVLRGNILAAVLATFFGNPLTYIPIITTSMLTGYWMLGLDPRILRFRERPGEDVETIGERFGEAGRELWQNTVALFTDDKADWARIHHFNDEIFFPFLVGGIIPGIIFGLVAYYISLPLISAYQNRRKGALAEKLASLKKDAAAKNAGKAKRPSQPR